MSRKRKSRKLPAPRNPFVAAALFKNAGTHRKADKAVRRAQHSGLAALRQSTRLLTDWSQFDSGQAHHESASENTVFKSVLCPFSSAG